MNSTKTPTKEAPKAPKKQLGVQREMDAGASLVSAVRAAACGRGALSAGDVLSLQRGVGNQAVMRLIQAKRSPAGGEDPTQVHAAAKVGVGGASGPLPHLETIQKAFGRHDVRGVVAHTGAQARAGAQAMGASAFTMGNHVAFAGSPDLHTAAHEAAHVVQQRGGVQLAGGVGEVGDRYERHADAVAAEVVAGRSAEPLLPAAQEGASGRAVQMISGKAMLGALVGGAALGTAAVVLGAGAGAVAGAMALGAVAGAVGGALLARPGSAVLPRSALAPAVAPDIGVDKEVFLPAGTRLFHGTRWKSGEPMWWRENPPNRDGEDGGVSFALDWKKTPKINNAQIILEYRLTQDLRVRGCAGKGNFFAIFEDNPDAACYTKFETELVMKTKTLGRRIVLMNAYHGSTRSSAEEMV